MDLENIIPLVIIAVAYLFKSFENAKKKEARKKPRSPAPAPAPGRKAPSSSRERRVVPQARETTPSASQGPKRDTGTYTPSAPAGWEIDYPPSGGVEPAFPTGGSHTRREIPEELVRQREAHQKRQAEARRQAGVAVHQAAGPVAAEAGGREEDEPFDLRDAVIKSAILERKEYMERREF